MSEHRLGEIVIERPRAGTRISLKKISGYKKTLHKITVIATEEGLLSPYLIKPLGKTKHFSDHLSPLQRWLKKQVGQPWDSVYSRLCQQIETRTLCGQHLLHHLRDMVTTEVEFINEVPYHRRYQSRPLGYWRDELYVHPETKQLCLAKKRPKRQPQKRDDLLKVDTLHQYRKLDGVWYFVTLRDIPFDGKVFDIVLQKTLTYWTATAFYEGKRFYAYHQRHCTKKEVKHILKQLAKP